MTPKIALDEQTLQLLQQAGELQVEDAHGVPVVLMTVAAREQLEKDNYDAGDWTPVESLEVAAESLSDPEGWGADGMDEYGKVYGSLFEDNAENH